MPRSLLFLALLAAAPVSAQWAQMNGPLPPDVGGLAADGDILVLGTGQADAGDVYRSTDGGQTWQNALLPNGGVLFAFAHEGVLYVGTYLSGMYRSDDGGLSWEPVEGLPVGFSDSFAAMTAVGDVLLLAPGILGSGPIQRSTDGGSTWAAVGSSTDYRALLAVDDTVVIAATLTGGFYRSTDAGLTWAPANAGLPSGARAGALTLHEGAAYLGLTATTAPVPRVYRSDNGGASWSLVSTDLPNLLGHDFLALASWRGALVAALGSNFSGAVYRSTNDGVNWTPCSDGLPDVRHQVLLPTAAALWLGTAEGAFRTGALDAPWAYAGQGTAAISGVASLLAEGETLFVGLTNNGGGGLGLWRTEDLGQTWERLMNGLSDRAAIQAIYRHGPTLFAGELMFPRGVYRSEDDGATWTLSSAGISASTIIYAIHAHAGVLFTGAHEALYRSTDGGFTWATVPQMSGTQALATFDGALWAGRGDGRVLRSADGGLSWTEVSTGLPPGGNGIQALVVSRGVLFAATWIAGVYRLEGTAWQPTGFGGNFVDTLLDVDGVLVAASALDGPFVSADGGETWTPFDEAYTGGEIYELAATDGHLVAGTRGHALWGRPRADLPSATAVAVAVAPVDPPVVVPPEGGSFAFTVTLTNTTAQPQTVQAWTAVTGPIDRSPVLGPIAVTLPPGAAVTRTLTQQVPGRAPAGTYTYTANVGTFPVPVLTSDGFTLTKQATERPAATSGTAADWATIGWSEATGDVASAARDVAGEARLAGVYPNPALGAVSITLTLPGPAPVTLVLYDALGRAVATLHDGPMEAGDRRIAHDVGALAPGVYRLVLRSPGRVDSQALTVLP